jgi:hypothetical protein
MDDRMQQVVLYGSKFVLLACKCPDLTQPARSKKQPGERKIRWDAAKYGSNPCGFRQSFSVKRGASRASLNIVFQTFTS